MPITVICAKCGKRAKAPDAAAGKRAKCPGCGAAVQVPEEEIVEVEMIDLPSQPSIAGPSSGLGSLLDDLSAFDTAHGEPIARAPLAAAGFRPAKKIKRPKSTQPVDGDYIASYENLMSAYGMIVVVAAVILGLRSIYSFWSTFGDRVSGEELATGIGKIVGVTMVIPVALGVLIMGQQIWAVWIQWLVNLLGFFSVLPLCMRFVTTGQTDLLYRLLWSCPEGIIVMLVSVVIGPRCVHMSNRIRAARRRSGD